ncbi:MAG: hypothetical protein C0599_17715 [Salinivirgaceae bacterium]|nr:MAG: hypothetical protein C0599_17715 [Salinivirgaceae bacterium]
MTPLLKQLLILFIILLVLFLAAMGVMMYHRILKKVHVKQGPFRKLNFVYNFHQGDYQKNMLILEEVMEKIKNKGLPVVSPVTIYYDNPRKTKRKELRSEIGFIVPDSVTQPIEGLEFKQIDNQEYIYTAFPYVSRFSIMIGAMKVYPAFTKYLKKHNLEEREIIEIYEMQNKNIIYLMPVK